MEDNLVPNGSYAERLVLPALGIGGVNHLMAMSFRS
jgi:hypothetical protein